MNRCLLLQAGLTEDEIRILELGREIKEHTGHGTLLVEYRGGREDLYHPTPREVPPSRRNKCS